MLNFLPMPLLFVIGVILLLINTLLWASLISLGGIVKLIFPVAQIRTMLFVSMNRLMWAWATCNGGILLLLADIRWDVEGIENLSQDKWYLLISNHLSGFDIAVITYLLRNNTPMLKFFLKQELLYVPLFGFGCWALDMPFMHRTSPAKLKKKPKLKGKDLAATRRACEKFKHTPTAIINYVEGSRFSEEKRQRQQSPYRHLLRPKAGGIAFTLSAMGEQFSKLLDITLVYPNAPKNILQGVLQGKVNHVVVRVQALDVPKVDNQRYFSDTQYRAEFQQWLNQLWAQKDQQIHRILLDNQASTATYQYHIKPKNRT